MAEEKGKTPTVHHLTANDLETGAPELDAPMMFTGATRAEIAERIREEIARLEALLALDESLPPLEKPAGRQGKRAWSQWVERFELIESVGGRPDVKELSRRTGCKELYIRRLVRNFKVQKSQGLKTDLTSGAEM